jgi:hypothetical protein
MSSNSRRFAAKVLFQYRVEGRSAKSPTLCELRIIVCEAQSERQAVQAFRRIINSSTCEIANPGAPRVQVRPIGIVDAMELGIEADPNEFWYEFRQITRAMKRREELTLHSAELLRRLSGAPLQVPRAEANSAKRTKSVASQVRLATNPSGLSKSNRGSPRVHSVVRRRKRETGTP